MGRREYLTRLAFGRSAFQAPADAEVKDKNEKRARDLRAESGPFPSYIQQYDEKGHPINPKSADLKRRMMHAQNDVLSTVGLCAKINDSKSVPPLESQQRLMRKVIDDENEDAINLHIASQSACFLFEPYAIGLRQRLQTFAILRGKPLSAIVQADWRYHWELHRSVGYLFAGGFATFAFQSLRVESLEALQDLFSSSKEDDPINQNSVSAMPQRLPRILISSLRVASFAFVAPLEVFATLQRLGSLRPWPALPGPKTYKVLLIGLFQYTGPSKQAGASNSVLNRIKLMLLMPLPLLMIISYVKPAIISFLLRYLQVMLPAPTKSGAHLGNDEEVDDKYEMILFGTTSDHKASSIIDLLASDLQAVGRSWQKLSDKTSRLLNASRDRFLTTVGLKSVSGISKGSPRRSNASSVQSMPVDLRSAMDALPQDVPESSGGEVFGSRSYPHDPDAWALRRHTSGGSHDQGRIVEVISRGSEDTSDDGEGPARAQPEGLMAPTPRSSSSSPVQSRAQTPPAPIEIATSNDPSGAMRMEVSVPIDDFDESRLTQPSQPPPGSDSDTDSSASDDSRESDTKKPHHRATGLSCFPARFMAQMLAEQITELLCLPLDAMFARSVVLSFCASPGSPFAVNAGAPRSGILPMGSWFGPGLKHGGWRGIADYAGKMFLVWGLDLGCRFMVWEIATGFMWWKGIRRYGWGTL